MCRKAVAHRVGHAGRRRVRAYQQGGIRAAAGALARQRACARRSAGAAHDRGARSRPASAPDFAALRKKLVGAGPGRDARRSSRLGRPHARDGAQRRRWSGSRVLALVLAATMLSVMFATRGAMATNRPIVEVLHFIGAQGRLHRRPIPAPLPAARAEGRRDRRRRGDRAVRAGRSVAGLVQGRRGGQSRPVRQHFARRRRLWRDRRRSSCWSPP